MKKFKFTFLLAFLLSTQLFATPSDIFGLGARNSSLGGANLFTDAREYGAKGNPASLNSLKKNLFGVSFSVNELNLENTELLPQSTISSQISRDSYEASKAEPLKNTEFGLIIPLGNRIVFGLAGTMPADVFASVYSFTTNESNYLHFNDRQQRPEIYTGLSVEINENFAVGAGLFYSLSVEGVLQTGISNTDAEARSFIELTPVYVPYGGIYYQSDADSDSRLKLGVSYRSEQAAKTDLDIQLRGGTNFVVIPIETNSKLIAFYDPAVFAFGNTVEYGNMATHFAIERQFWGNYKAPILVLGGNDIRTLVGGGITGEVVNLRDTWNLRLGQEFKDMFRLFNGNVSAQMGFEYHQSALPDAPTSLAVVDSDKYVANAGASIAFNSFRTFIRKPIELFVSFKYIKIEDQTYSATNKIGVNQTARSSGSVLGALGGVSIDI